ncbi:hypothetical protein BO78DRAFT_416727 [Aspergillus sclerotiicarbonarius CBS 121057]|uniref:Uncharacterized protein n=1 Tax=Aspergillus sclerotiicarbonarius (strain CBS 121057 / IBT 28362) TaxID=1448318 RepID=A0A319EGB7_ASPSB|nr:hypothetical protein BO78DRAFT_416727 [Aspergillus sclerotiicarbonarius CBS 121057]
MIRAQSEHSDDRNVDNRVGSLGSEQVEPEESIRILKSAKRKIQRALVAVEDAEKALKIVYGDTVDHEQRVRDRM